jgi:signal peptidase II
VGNLIDRLIYGAVADFFHFFAFGYNWYVFNVADIAITFGVIALLYDAVIRPETRAGQSS